MAAKTTRYQKIIMWIWIGFLIVVITILFLQGLFGRYGDRYGEVISWFLPNILPSLSILTGGIVITGRNNPNRLAEAHRYIILITICTSILYCLLLICVVIFAPFARLSPITLMKQGNFLFAPLQSVVNFFLLTYLYQINRGITKG
jgi:hypothetical protein